MTSILLKIPKKYSLITGCSDGAKSRRILQDNELMAGLQNGKLALMKPVDNFSELFVELWNNWPVLVKGI